MKSLQESLFDSNLINRGLSIDSLYKIDLINTNIQIESWFEDNFDIDKFVRSHHKISKKDPDCPIFGKTINDGQITDIEKYILSYINSIIIKKTIDNQKSIVPNVKVIGTEIESELSKYILPKQKKNFSVHLYIIPAGFIINLVIYKGNYRFLHIPISELEHEIAFQFTKK